ncbi:hypothetical protein QBZ16_001744 [Prototheca wickerhamii]|uniref:Uncharacterized protein n=1 Tax=Prototheca wickerhamii TaxID=3111 RepID=A0AAD9ID21_PROWI|nr:hypothetical protein QBZ16_001744 [Prototheca wickerhamii]
MVWDPFAPLEGRTPSVVVARNRQYNQARLILTTPACSRTEVMVINEMSGRLERAGDYATEDEALTALHAQGFAAEHRASALLGFVATGCLAGALLASKTREKGVLPGGHAVHVVVDANWLLLPLGPLATAAAAAGVPQGALPTELLPSEEMDFWRSIQAVTLDNAHYYCWTADLTRPFPSFHPAQDPEP